jgi:hypothetical protein
MTILGSNGLKRQSKNSVPFVDLPNCAVENLKLRTSNMSEPLCRFTPAGLEEFVKWIRLGASGTVPRDLITDRSYSEPLSSDIVVSQKVFRDRYEFGKFLVELLKPFEHRSISFDRGLWSWLAAYYF